MKFNSFQIEELVHSLSYHLDELDSQAKAGHASLNQAAAAVLREDDKLMLSFQKLTSELEAEGPEGVEDSQYIRDLCARYFIPTNYYTVQKLT